MNLISNMRFAVRLLLKNPGSSVMAILVMAVGTSVSITMFVFIKGVLWSSLGVEEDREVLIVRWSERDKIRNSRDISPLDQAIFREEAKSFEKMTAFYWHGYPFYNPSGDALAKSYLIALVDYEFFDFLGEAPWLGRTFTAGDVPDEASYTAVVSHRLWQEHFGGDKNAIGSIAVLNGKPCTIVGVMPKGFRFPDNVDVWALTDWRTSMEKGRSFWRRLLTLVVLEDGVSKTQAKAELDTIATRLANELPETNENLDSVEFERYATWYAGDSFTRLLYVLFFCSILVLAVACANVFNLIMTRIAGRTSELSIRNALGAQSLQIIAHVMLDGMILAILGTIAGATIAVWCLKLVWAMILQFRNIPYWWNLELDASVFGFVVAVVVLSALASSLIPGLRASRSLVAENLKDDSRTSSGLFIGSLSKVILGIQVMVTGVLAFVSITILLAWFEMRNRDFPYEPQAILNAGVTLSGHDNREEALTLVASQNALRDRLLTYPGIEAVAFSRGAGGGAVPGLARRSFFTERRFEVEGEVYETEEMMPVAAHEGISGDFAAVFGIEPLIGRNMSDLDTPFTEQVCMVNKAFVERYWPNENPIGKRIKFHGVQSSPDFRTVVGVLPNILPKPLPDEDPIENGFFRVYLPFSQTFGFGAHSVMLKTRGDPRGFEEILRRELNKVDPSRSFRGEVRTLREIYDESFTVQQIVFKMFGAFGIASLIMGVVGLYAVSSFATRQRSREFGIRMALGADSLRIVSEVFRSGIVLLVVGGVLGVAVGHFVSVLLKAEVELSEMSFGITYPVVAAVLLLTTLISMGFPAWYASRIEPNKALRED